MSTRSMLIALALGACSAQSSQIATDRGRQRPAPADATAPRDTPAPREPQPPRDAPAPAPSATTDTSASSSLWRIRAAMPMSGSLDDDVLITVINGQLGPLDRCVALIRKTNKVVGSLNLRVTVTADGNSTTELQSPLDDEAKRCVLDGIRDWRIRGAGHGDAMVLLELTDRAKP